MKFTNRLIYNNEIVGVRACIGHCVYNETKHNVEFIDIPLDMAQSILVDYLIDMNKLQGEDIVLEMKSGLLVGSEDYKYKFHNCPETKSAFYSNFKISPEGSDLRLREWYNLYNRMLFNNELTDTLEVAFSNRQKSVGGTATVSRLHETECRIRMATWYMKQVEYDIEACLIHEMIHIYLPITEGHGRRFLYMVDRCNQLLLVNNICNITVDRYTKQANKEIKYKYILYCKNCMTFTQMQRKPSAKYFCRCKREVNIFSKADIGFYKAWYCKDCNNFTTRSSVEHTSPSSCATCGSERIIEV